MSEAAISGHPSLRTSLTRPAGALMIAVGGFLILGGGSAPSPLASGGVFGAAVLALGALVVTAGALVMAVTQRVPAGFLQAIPPSMILALCGPTYVALAEGSADAAAPWGAEPLLACCAFVAAHLSGKTGALASCALAVGAYVPVAFGTGGSGAARILYLAAACGVAAMVAVPARSRLEALWAVATGRERNDELTGLLSSHAFGELLAHELSRCQRSGISLAVLTVDLDGFHRVNDANGAAAGDQALRDTAQVLRTQMRGSDVLARTAGDEFRILLPACGRDDALRRAEHIRSLLERTSATWPTPFTASVGVAVAPEHANTVVDLADSSAAALVAAKAAGPNAIALPPTSRRGGFPDEPTDR